VAERRPTPQEQDEQPPPGGPQRTDAPDPTGTGPEPGQGETERDLQEENAETSLDQPST
jgi:hypothetical protein